jgi:hypothetical protein
MPDVRRPTLAAIPAVTEDFRAVSVFEALRAALLFAMRLAAALAVIGLRPSSSTDLTSGDIVLIGGLVLSPTPIVSTIGFLRQLVVAPGATPRGHAGISFISGILFVSGWYPLTLCLALLLQPVERAGIRVLSEGVGFFVSAAYWLLGPVLLPTALAYLVRRRVPSPETAA